MEDWLVSIFWVRPLEGGDVVLGVVKMLMSSHELDGPCVGIGAASIDLEGAASEGAALMPAPPMGGATPMGGFSPAQATNVESLQVM